MMNYIENYKGIKCSTYTASNLVKELSDLLQNVCEYTNRKLDTSVFKKTVKNLTDDVSTFKNITIDEVKAALKNGMRGGYGDVIDISNLVLYKWLTSYLNSKDRLEAIAKYESQFAKPRELTKEEIELKDTACLKELFIQFKLGQINYISSFRGGWYDFLLRKNVPDLADWKQFESKAKHVLISEECKSPANRGLSEKKFQSLINGIQNGNADEKTRIMYKAKELAVNEYFEIIDTLNI